MWFRVYSLNPIISNSSSVVHWFQRRHLDWLAIAVKNATLPSRAIFYLLAPLQKLRHSNLSSRFFLSHVPRWVSSRFVRKPDIDLFKFCGYCLLWRATPYMLSKWLSDSNEMMLSFTQFWPDFAYCSFLRIFVDRRSLQRLLGTAYTKERTKPLKQII